MMSEKQRVAVSLTEENVEWIDANYNNRSAFIDDVITDFREGRAAKEDVIAEYRIRQLRAERASLESQLEALDDQMEALEDTVTTKEQLREDVMSDAVEELRGVPADPTNPAIESWAKKADVPPAKFAEKLQERREQ